MEGLLKLIQPSAHYPLLLFHVDTNYTTMETWHKSDYRALGAVVKGVGALVVVLNILPIRVKGVKRKTLIVQVNNDSMNNWLQSWCW